MKKRLQITLRVNDLEAKHLEALKEVEGLNNSDVLRRGMWLMFDSLLKPEPPTSTSLDHRIETIVKEVLKEKGYKK